MTTMGAEEEEHFRTSAIAESEWGEPVVVRSARRSLGAVVSIRFSAQELNDIRGLSSKNLIDFIRTAVLKEVQEQRTGESTSSSK
jgi:hypothetical protein